MVEQVLGTKHEIYRITLPTPFAVGNVYAFLLKGDALTLIDVGPKTEEATYHLTTSLKELGYTFADLDYIALTHHHVDHIGFLGELDAYQLPVVGHRYNEPWMKQDASFIQQMEQEFLDLSVRCGVEASFLKNHVDFRALFYFAQPTRYSLATALKEGDTLPGFHDFRVLETPGHAGSHLMFYDETEGLTIGGDVLLKHIASNPILEPTYEQQTERTKPLLQYRQSMKRCSDLEMKRILPSHGEEITEVKELVAARFKRQETRALKVYEWLKEEELTVWEVCKRLFPKAYQKEFLLTLSETIGQMDYLHSKGKIKRIEGETRKVVV